MESGTFVDPDVMKDMEENFIPARLFTYGLPKAQDTLEKENKTIFHKYYTGDTTAPAYAITTPDGTPVYLFSGPIDSDDFLDHLAAAKQAAQQ